MFLNATDPSVVDDRRGHLLSPALTEMKRPPMSGCWGEEGGTRGTGRMTSTRTLRNSHSSLFVLGESTIYTTVLFNFLGGDELGVALCLQLESTYSHSKQKPPLAVTSGGFSWVRVTARTEFFVLCPYISLFPFFLFGALEGNERFLDEIMAFWQGR